MFYEAVEELNLISFVNNLTEVHYGFFLVRLTCFITLLLPHRFLEHARHPWKPQDGDHFSEVTALWIKLLLKPFIYLFFDKDLLHEWSRHLVLLFDELGLVLLDLLVQRGDVSFPLLLGRFELLLEVITLVAYFHVVPHSLWGINSLFHDVDVPPDDFGLLELLI